jgi:FtsP/CotA-like multicopper oxidase with cupredoxin domain
MRLAGHSMTVTHADGNPIEPVQTDVLRIGMGERYDVFFEADHPGHWYLAASEEGYGEGRLRIPVHYDGVQTAEAKMPQFHPPLRLVDYGSLRAREPFEQQAPAGGDELEFGQTLSGGMHSPFWSINGQFYPDADPLPIRRGDRIRLRYWNRSMMPHPMHLHGHFFRLVNPALPRSRWPFKDTVIVDPMQQAEVEFVADNPGNWFHHCHNLYHMEAGMANVVVYSP